MKQQLRLVWPSLACLFAMTGAAGAADGPVDAKYQPQLGPRFAAGETFTYHATVDYTGLVRMVDLTKTKKKDANGDTRNVRTDKVRASEQPHFSAELLADTALARKVFKNGSLQEAEFLIRHCELIDEKGDTMELLPANAIVGARKQADGQVAFAINGKIPSAELAARLSVLIAMGDEHTTANDFLGAPSPMPVGATWAVNEKAMLKSDLPRVFPGVDRLAGSVALRSAQTDRTGTLRTTVTSTYRLGDVHPPFPSYVIANPSNVSFEIAVTAPAAPGPGQYDVESKVVIRHTGHTGDIQVGLSETDMEVSFTIDQDAHYVLGGTGGSGAGALASAPPVPDMPPLAIGMSSAPVLRSTPLFWQPNSAAGSTVELQPTSNAVPTSPAPAKPAPPAQSSAAPLIIPADSPFSKAQDLPGPPAKTK